MYLTTHRRPGIGQYTVEIIGSEYGPTPVDRTKVRLQPAMDPQTRAIMDLPSKLPAAMTSLEYQPGFTPVAGQPGAFTVQMAPAGGVMAWLEKNKTLAFIGAGTLLMLVMMSPAGRRRR